MAAQSDKFEETSLTFIVILGATFFTLFRYGPVPRITPNIKRMRLRADGSW